VYPSLFEGFGVPVLEAMACGVPPLTSQGTSMQEIGGEAALYFDPNDPADMADKLMLIYKDESLRSRLVSRGASVVSQYTWDRTAEAVWEAMMRALKGSRGVNSH
jgi:glycosyltransferase involved in cell wall biosynthesis